MIRFPLTGPSGHTCHLHSEGTTALPSNRWSPPPPAGEGAGDPRRGPPSRTAAVSHLPSHAPPRADAWEPHSPPGAGDWLGLGAFSRWRSGGSLWRSQEGLLVMGHGGIPAGECPGLSRFAAAGHRWRECPPVVLFGRRPNRPRHIRPGGQQPRFGRHGPPQGPVPPGRA